MARKARDFRAEYARRKAKGEAEGLTPAEYRGHVTAEYEKEQREVSKRRKAGIESPSLTPLDYWTKKTQEGSLEHWKGIVEDALEKLIDTEGEILGPITMTRLLKQNAQNRQEVRDRMNAGKTEKQARDGSQGQKDFYANKDTYSYLPWDIFHYAPN